MQWPTTPVKGGGAPAIVTAMKEYFMDDGSTSPIYGTPTYPSAVYYADQDKTLVSYEAWDGVTKRIKVTAFDHVSKEWSPGVTAFTHGYAEDDHGVPSICRDHQGYLHCFGGAHNSAVIHAYSNAPNDPSAWTQYGFIQGGSYSYPHPALVGGTLYMFSRLFNNSDRYVLQLHKTTSLNNGVPVWGSGVSIGDMGTDTRWYQGAHLVRGTDIHMTAAKANQADTGRVNVYYLIYDTVTGNLKNIDGSKVITPANFPVQLSDLDAFFSVFLHTGSNFGVPPSLAFIGDVPHLLFADGVTPSFAVKHTFWTGTAWSTPETIGTMNHRYADGPILNVKQNGDLEATWPGINVAFTRGGNIVRRARVGGVWGSESTVRVATRWPLDRVVNVLNGKDELRQIFYEHTGDAPTKVTGHNRGYAYGDDYVRRAFVLAPTTSAAALIARMPDAMTAPQQAAVAALFEAIYPLKDKLSTFAVLGATSLKNALIDWFNPDSNYAFWGAGAGTLDPKVGMTFSGNTNSLISRWSPGEDAIYLRDNCHLGVFVVGHNTKAAADVAIGRGGAPALAVSRLDTFSFARANDANPTGGISPTVAFTTSLGHTVVRRTGSNARQLLRDGVVVGTATGASTELPREPLRIGGDGATNTARKLLAAHVGSGTLSDADVNTIRNALIAYQTAILA